MSWSKTNGWWRQFEDGFIEFGTDEKVRVKAASWRNKPERHIDKRIIAVGVIHNGTRIGLYSNSPDTRWWQEDEMRLLITPGSGIATPEFTRRTIYRKVSPGYYAFDKKLNGVWTVDCEMVPIYTMGPAVRSLEESYATLDKPWIKLFIEPSTNLIDWKVVSLNVLGIE